jgi:hypothetical protein
MLTQTQERDCPNELFKKKSGASICTYVLYPILKIIINRRPITLTHTLLPLIHLGNHPTRTRLLRLLIIPQSNKPRKPQTNPLSIRARQYIRRSFVPWTQRQIGSLNLPDEFGLEPDVRLVLVAGGVDVEGFGAVDDERLELGVEVFENRFGEAGADVADCFVGLGGGVVAGE